MVAPSLSASRRIHCPQCGREIAADEQFCPHCGVHLGLAAIVGEREIILSQLGQETDLAVESLVPRLGERLVQKGLITEMQLQQALDYQQERAQDGEKIRIGRALVRLGFLNEEALDQAIAETLLQLQEALYQSSVRLQQQVEKREQQLQEALSRLAELQRVKANFVASISHELRTPLAHIIGYLDLLHDGDLGSLTDEQRRAVQVMQNAAERLRLLIEDLIGFALLSQGEIVLNPQPVAVEKLFSEALAPLRTRAAAKGVHLQEEIPRGVRVLADGEKITWVLRHLLDNAIKFAPPDGTVWLQATPRSAEVHFMVEDSGPGIHARHLRAVFEPFAQLEDATHRRHGGAGLGLALAKQVLEAHQTTLEVVSKVGRFTRFSFSLPKVEEDVTAQPRENSPRMNDDSHR